MDCKRTRGRQRIPLRRIEKQEDRLVSFSKRKDGMFKKASEIATLCNVDIGLLVSSPSKKIFSFFSPNVDIVLGKLHNQGQPTSESARLFDAHVRAKLDYLNKQLDGILSRGEFQKNREKLLESRSQSRPTKGWLELPVEELNEEQVGELTNLLEDFLVESSFHLQRLENGASTSQPIPQEQEDPSNWFLAPSDAVPLPPDHADALNNQGFALTEQPVEANAFENEGFVLPLPQADASAINSQGYALPQPVDLASAFNNQGYALPQPSDHANAFNNQGYVLPLPSDHVNAFNDQEYAVPQPTDHSSVFNNEGCILPQSDYATAFNNQGYVLPLPSDPATAFCNQGFGLPLPSDPTNAFSNQGFGLCVPPEANPFNRGHVFPPASVASTFAAMEIDPGNQDWDPLCQIYASSAGAFYQDPYRQD